MLSSGAARDVAARPASAEGERELKFTFPESRAHLVRRRLASLCRPDPEFPGAIVWTIYYDTPALVSLGEKINSDFLKVKLRVRWYSDFDRCASGPAFVEAKLRIGTRRMKVRERLAVPAREIASWDLQDARLRAFPALLRRHGIAVQESWQPAMLIRYRRDRFLEHLSASRVSLDADIAAEKVNPRLRPAADRSPLGSGVLEVKGYGNQLPPALRPLLELGIQKRSFSKFLAVYAHATRTMF